jgi:hypothetical protein
MHSQPSQSGIRLGCCKSFSSHDGTMAELIMTWHYWHTHTDIHTPTCTFWHMVLLAAAFQCENVLTAKNLVEGMVFMPDSTTQEMGMQQTVLSGIWVGCTRCR